MSNYLKDVLYWDFLLGLMTGMFGLFIGFLLISFIGKTFGMVCGNAFIAIPLILMIIRDMKHSYKRDKEKEK